MTSTDDLFNRANAQCHRRAYEQWHRRQSKQHILRSQVGFSEPASSQPKPCRGCAYYYGLAHGTTRANRHILVCAIHPYGWQTSEHCPDWQAEDTSPKVGSSSE